MILWIILGIILLLLLLLLFIPIGIGAKYEKSTFILVKIAFVKLEIPLNKIIGKSSSKKQKTKEKVEKTPEEELERNIVGLDFVLSLLGDFRRFVRKRFTLSQFDMNIRFGTADAASTAVSTGLLWTLSYNLLSLVDKLIYVDNPKVEITPLFNDATFSINASGIIKTRLAHIIATAIVFAHKYLKYKRQKRRKSK